MVSHSTQPMNSLQEAYDPEAFRRWGHELIDLLADQVTAVQRKPELPVITYQNPTDEYVFWQQDFASNDGTPLDFFQAVLVRSIQLHHPHYIGHQVSVPALVSSLAGLVSDVLSNGTGVYEMGMASNAIERVVTEYTAQQIGYPMAAGGLLTSGGTLANLTALLAARQAKAPTNVWEQGHEHRLAVLVSEEAHYCIDRAARILGMGAEGIIKVPTDEYFRIKTDALEAILSKAKVDGLLPIAVVGCAGSTATGSYDDLEALAAFSQKHNLWFHVDGAHGGAVVFSTKYRHLAKGIAQADSVVIDYHKMLMTPALNTALLFKDGRDAYRTFAQRAQYLWETQQSPEWYHSGKKTFECTKLMMSIKVYAILRTHGKQVFAENVDRLYDQARIFAQQIEQHADLELALTPEANIVNFRFVNCPSEQRDLLNARIRQALIDAGDFYIVQTIIRGERFLRCTVMNPLTDETVFSKLLTRVTQLGEQLQ